MLLLIMVTQGGSIFAGCSSSAPKDFSHLASMIYKHGESVENSLETSSMPAGKTRPGKVSRQGDDVDASR